MVRARVRCGTGEGLWLALRDSSPFSICGVSSEAASEVKIYTRDTENELRLATSGLGVLELYFVPGTSSGIEQTSVVWVSIAGRGHKHEREKCYSSVIKFVAYSYGVGVLVNFRCHSSCEHEAFLHEITYSKTAVDHS